MNNNRPRPITLIILDGWGHRESKEANAIAQARKPNWDKYWSTFPHTTISGSGRCVGLPQGQMGNSEVGHLNMGAGRIVYQDFTRIDNAIETGEFFENAILKQALTQAKQTNKAVHVLGLLSPGGVHSHERHLFALVELAARLQVPALYLHPFLDGRDTPPKSALASIENLESVLKQNGIGQIASLIGRYYAMDRDKRWERVKEAYDLIVTGTGLYQAESATQALEAAYSRGETDEFVKATAIHDHHAKPITVNDGDIIIFMNFRSDRARELTQSFIDADFHEFAQPVRPKLGQFVCLSEYDNRFKTPVAFPPTSLQNILSSYLSEHGLRQLRIAETEKYAHVTFFFNGGVEKPYPLEDRILIPSPKVATYDLQPEMSAPEIANKLSEIIKAGKYDVIICNFANADMVGHTGDFAATVHAIETLDTCLGKIISTSQEVGGEVLITADHGNAEMMFDPTTNQPHTAHTSDPVPFLYIGRNAMINNDNGKLSDIAPTILHLLNLPQPAEMTGKTLIKLV